jgi:hypothetical protein
MTSMLPEAAEAERRTTEIADLLAQAIALAERVEALPDGAMKEKLRAALIEIRANIGEPKSEMRHAG